ncbi:ankyrin repeat domain-containing protein [Aurantiacibacter spongiae]|uniref:ankyrin repeat domain-containing protein n=1 Tax=Aurantiacibacter spongiae TaxID=2488860 RepID=UPI001F2D01E3|nr:ankyrin repeat domain-containing protein [Aurantiacibacter spongiae]
MARLTLRATALFLAGPLVLLAASPVAAQLYSDGYKFLEAVKDKDGETATAMLNEPGSTIVNSRDLTSGETGLHLAVNRRDLTWTRFLLQQHANPNIADNRGRTPLILAADAGFLEAVQTLIDHGAQVDVTTTTGETPLIAAVHAHNIELMEVLLDAGADPDRTDNTGRSARDYARQPGQPQRLLSIIERHEVPSDERETQVYGPVF